jgi:predicted RNA-binding protein with PUA-like domain
MARWLVKQEPSTYSWTDLVRDGRTRWDGVHNALALQHLRKMALGEEALFYHSGTERACVGILRIAAPAVPDPDDARGSWYVEVTPVRPLARPVPLSEIRADPAFRDTELVRFSRLSVMPFPERAWTRLMGLAARPAASLKAGTKRPARRPARRPRAPARSRKR